MEFIPAKQIVSSASGYWFGYNYNMNIYKGCSHGCIYCDSRSECYQIKNFDTVCAKKNALEIINKDLKSKRNKGVVMTGGMSDPYNPQEKKHMLTRGALKLIDTHGFGVGICTKSDLVLRDIDLLKSIKKNSPALVLMTITTFDDEKSRIIEPYVSTTSERFSALRTLSENGIDCGILLMPILPFINDTEENILNIVNEAHAVGAKYIYPSFGVTLRQNQREYYYSQLDIHFKGLANDYIKKYGDSYQCGSDNYKRLKAVFEATCKTFDIKFKMKDIAEDYKRGYEFEQLSFF